jgi:hypothetical protein
MPDISPGEPRNGRIVTFYSYKGGTGRTMALANVAWILASSGNRVLAADWDLESPGLHRFFAPFLDSSVPDAAGVVDLVRRYEWAAQESEEAERLRVHIPAHAQLQQYVLQVRNWTFPGGGSLEFLSPGKQNRDYLATLSALDWDNFHETLNGGEFIDAVRADMRRHYDYALIDSRTGLGDLADVCTFLTSSSTASRCPPRAWRVPCTWPVGSRRSTAGAAYASCRYLCAWMSSRRTVRRRAGCSPSGCSATCRRT